MDTIIILVVLGLFIGQFICIKKYDDMVSRTKLSELEEYKTKYIRLKELVCPKEN